MEVFCWIKPQVNPFFPIIEPISKDISLKNNGLPFHIAKELEVDFVVVRLIGRQLCIYIHNSSNNVSHKHKKKKKSCKDMKTRPLT